MYLERKCGDIKRRFWHRYSFHGQFQFSANTQLAGLALIPAWVLNAHQWIEILLQFPALESEKRSMITTAISDTNHNHEDNGEFHFLILTLTKTQEHIQSSMRMKPTRNSTEYHHHQSLSGVHIFDGKVILMPMISLIYPISRNSIVFEKSSFEVNSSIYTHVFSGPFSLLQRSHRTVYVLINGSDSGAPCWVNGPNSICPRLHRETAFLSRMPKIANVYRVSCGGNQH